MSPEALPDFPSTLLPRQMFPSLLATMKAQPTLIAENLLPRMVRIPETPKCRRFQFDER